MVGIVKKGKLIFCPGEMAGICNNRKCVDCVLRSFCCCYLQWRYSFNSGLCRNCSRYKKLKGGK